MRTVGVIEAVYGGPIWREGCLNSPLSKEFKSQAVEKTDKGREFQNLSVYGMKDLRYWLTLVFERWMK